MWAALSPPSACASSSEPWVQWDPGTKCNSLAANSLLGLARPPSCLPVVRHRGDQGAKLPTWLSPMRQFRSAVNDDHGHSRKYSAEGASKAEEEKGRPHTINCSELHAMLKVEPAVLSFVQVAPSWRALHSHPLGGIKTYKSSNILSSVKCSMTAQPNTVISFSFLPEPVPDLSGPRSLHGPSLALQRRVTSASCISQVPKVS